MAEFASEEQIVCFLLLFSPSRSSRRAAARLSRVDDDDAVGLGGAHGVR